MKIDIVVFQENILDRFVALIDSINSKKNTDEITQSGSLEM